ncbi:MAG: ABC transporter substrate-binding protein [Promethearchaeota archaeon]
MKKKFSGLFFLLVLVSISIFTYPSIQYKNPKKSIEFTQSPNIAANVPFIVCYDHNPSALDIVDTLDTPTRNIQHQVVEGLVEYDLSDHPNYTIVPTLAESWIWKNPTEISFMLRKGVQFHDGHSMTAADVKWNFERVQYFINATGTLPSNTTAAYPRSLFFHLDGTPIFDSFKINGLYNFTIVLTKPFGALLDLLCFGVTDILSPFSTPRYQYLDLDTEILVGTGPFVYDGFTRDVDVRFHAFRSYWQGEASIKEMNWEILEDDTERMIAALAGDYDIVQGVPLTWLNTFRDNPIFHVEDIGEDLYYFYMELYCGNRNTDGTPLGGPQFQKNNATFRRALALAINYTYIYDEVQNGYADEGTPAVPRAMPGHNDSVVQASDSKFTWEENVEKAREIIKTMWGLAQAGDWNTTYPGPDEALWTGNTFRTLEVNRHFGSSTNQRLNLLLDWSFELIGVDTHETIRQWNDYLEVGENSPWEMDIGYLGRYPDYLNPYNMIDPLFNLASHSCFSRINDTSPGGLTELMNAAATETNLTIQLEYYQAIQSLIYDIERPVNPASHCHISGWVYFMYSCHKAGLVDFHYNVLQLLDLYSIEWAPANFFLDSDAASPERYGNFNLTWSDSQRADNYSILTYHRYITEINSSLTQLAFQDASSPYPITGFPEGDHYFIVVAYNDKGYTLSNCINVTVLFFKPGPFNLYSTADTPDTDGSFILYWTNSSGARNYSIYSSDSFITNLDPGLSLEAEDTNTPYAISDLGNGDYFFIAVAYNESGYTLSNCIEVEVQLEKEEFILGYNGYLLTTIIGLISVVKISRYKRKKLKEGINN